MNKKKKYIILIILIIVLIISINYSAINKALEGFLLDYEIAHIDRVIDGDTIVSNETSIRLLGINSPERGEIYYTDAKKFLEKLVLNETVRLEFGKDREDKYRRTLAYIYLDRENINLKLIEEGYANFYFPSGRDMYYEDFKKAWEECSENLCEISKDECASCIKLTKFDYKNEIIILKNICSFDCELTDWGIKDEGRKNFVFPEFVLKDGKEVEIIVGDGEDNKDNLFWKDETYVWTSSGDSLFLRDDEGKLVLWESY